MVQAKDKFMKTNYWQKALATLVVAGLVASASTVLAQTTPVTSPAPVSTAPPLAYGVPQVLQLVQAKVGDDTIIAYINNAHISYNLDASQIIYLRQLGISDPVLMAMLNQPKAGVAPAPAPVAYSTPPAPAPVAAPTAPAPTVTYVQSQPSVTYVQSAPPTVYYTQPYYYPSYGYGYYPPVSLSLGFGWGWGGGWRGGGWHGGGGWHR